MKNKKARKKPTRKVAIFRILYFVLAISFVLTSTILNLSDYSSFEVQLLSILRLPFFAVVLFILVLIDGLLTFSDKKRKLFICGFCIGNILIFSSMPFVIKDITTFLMLTINIVIPLIYAVYSLRYKTKFTKGKKANLNAPTITSLCLICIHSVGYGIYNNHINEDLLFLHTAYLSVGLLFCFTILSLTVFKQAYLVFAKKTSKKILIVLCAVFFTFAGSFVVTNMVNTGFSSERHTNTFEIIDKSSYGSRGTRHYVIYIIYNGEKINVPVSTQTFINKEIGQTLIVHTYSGFLSIPYITSGE